MHTRVWTLRRPPRSCAALRARISSEGLSASSHVIRGKATQRPHGTRVRHMRPSRGSKAKFKLNSSLLDQGLPKGGHYSAHTASVPREDARRCGMGCVFVLWSVCLCVCVCVSSVCVCVCVCVFSAAELPVYPYPGRLFAKNNDEEPWEEGSARRRLETWVGAKADRQRMPPRSNQPTIPPRPRTLEYRRRHPVSGGSEDCHAAGAWAVRLIS